ncbi:MAG TPA: TerB family tellurite resistance protein [Gammaproteobacteria bacterium]|nr:TerB family tellurite resistance protein [Gammaproteobacteria bacterium]
MLKALNELLDRALGGADETPLPDREHALRVATAVLLIEVARADYAEDLSEDQATFALIKEFFELSDGEAELLIDEARRQADHAISLQTFTRTLHEQLTVPEKHRVVEMLWKVALADERLDKYEDYVVRKVADLLYVSHSDLVRIRNRVRGD